MVLIQPINWNRVASSLAEAWSTFSATELDISHSCIRLLNFGPGTGLVRSTEKLFKIHNWTSIDLTSDDVHDGKTQPKQEPIAIVGMTVNMPGAPNTAKLWEVLKQGINTCSEVNHYSFNVQIPESSFKVIDYNNPANPKSTRTLKAYTGNFISTASSFDHTFFNVSLQEARSMDPQQRVLLHTAYEALKNTGYVPDTTPMFMGVSWVLGWCCDEGLRAKFLGRYRCLL
jgi:hypothetical protein